MNERKILLIKSWKRNILSIKNRNKKKGKMLSIKVKEERYNRWKVKKRKKVLYIKRRKKEKRKKKERKKDITDECFKKKEKYSL